MSHIRQDPTTNEWVIIAPDRRRRADQFEREGGRREALPVYRETCPFCPGHDDLMPDVIFSLPQDRQNPKEWKVLVLPNKYPALTPEGSLERKQESRFRWSMDGVGKHEVIVETPLHNSSISEMDYDQVEDIVRVYQLRYQALSKDPRFALILIFKNYGESAGTSLVHSHTQVIATPVVPATIRKKYEVAIDYFDTTGGCLYLDMIDDEIEAGDRIIVTGDRFVVFHPFASRTPYETWIAPREHRSSFSQASKDELKEFAHVLKDTLRRLYVLLDDPDYNFVIHTAPLGDENKEYYLWHLQIVPRLTIPAGFEMGSGIYINTAVPEETAAAMRDVKLEG